MSSWTLVPLIPLFDIAPITKILFVGFYIYAGWTLLAVMTGVVSFNMIALRAQITKEDNASEAAKKTKAKEVLLEIFEFSDADRSGELSFDEFTNMVNNQEIIKTIEEGTNIKMQDLEDLWHWLDDDNSETISWEEFFRGFVWLNEPFKPKTLLRLQEKVTKMVHLLQVTFLDLITKTFDGIIQHVQPPMRKMHAVTEQVQLIEAACQSLRISIGKVQHEAAIVGQVKSSKSPHLDKDSYTLNDFETRIGSQIEEVLLRLDRFQPTQPAALAAFKDPKAAARAAAAAGVVTHAPAIPQKDALLGGAAPAALEDRGRDHEEMSDASANESDLGDVEDVMAFLR